MDFPGRAGGHYHNTSYGSYAVDENVVLSRGRLHLVADNKPVVGTDPAGTYRYTEGFISSHDKFFQAYGYWEICTRFPAGKGLWPAFWLIPQDRSWPPEIDVAEWFGSIEGMHTRQAHVHRLQQRHLGQPRPRWPTRRHHQVPQHLRHRLRPRLPHLSGVRESGGEPGRRGRWAGWGCGRRCG